MKIGIKFCGGCNPRHNRGEMASRLRQALDTVHDLEAAKPGKDYDYLLLIGGCTNCCADITPFGGRVRIIRITGEQDFETVIHTIHTLSDSSATAESEIGAEGDKALKSTAASCGTDTPFKQ